MTETSPSSYLLDTSALLALPKQILGEHTFHTSPYCIWKLLTHLDEKEFTRRKGQLLKVRSTFILDEPQATVERRLLVHDELLQTRVSDEELITNALAALHDSDCLERFYSSVIRDSNGNLRQLSNCASRARKILDKEEKRYKRFIKDIVSLLYSSQVQIANNMDRHWKF